MCVFACRARTPSGNTCHATRHTRAGVACGCAQACRQERARECGGRTSATAASYAMSWLPVQACANWRGVCLRRFGVRPSLGCGRHSGTRGSP